MWQIIKNEWRYFSRTKMLLGITIGFSLVLFLTVVLGNYQTKTQKRNYQEAKEHLREQWENIKEMNPHRAAHYGTYVFKPSNLLSGLDDGINSVTGNILRVEGHVQNEMVHSEASQMQSISRFGKLKSALLLQYIVPLLLLFLGFTSVSSEKQSGRLKMLVLQGVKPLQLVLAKTLSVWFYGLSLLILLVTTYSLLNIQNINADAIQRTLFLFLAYALYYLILCGLSIFISARWQNPTLTLTSMLGIWILWTIFLPHIMLSAVEKWHTLPSREVFKTAMKEDRSKGLDGHNPSDERKKEFEKQIIEEYGVDSLSQLPINFDGLLMQADEEYGNKVWDKHFGNIRSVMAKQKQKLQISGLFNPFIALQNASKGFSGTDNLHHQDYLLQVESYRRYFIKTLNDKHAFGGSKTGDWGWKAGNDFYKSIPDFNYKPTTLGIVFIKYLIDLGSLLFWTLLTIGLLLFGTKNIKLL